MKTAGLLKAAGLLALAAAVCAGQPPTALDRYVAAPDPNYRYELVTKTDRGSFTFYSIDMTSQKWRTEQEVNRTLWKHWLNIIVPKEVKSTTAFLFISGGSNPGKPSTVPDPMLAAIANKSHTVVADLHMIPNEPLTFPGESKQRTEDGIISYTWDKFLRTGDETWPARLPMTKAAVRAMDTVQDFCGKQPGGGTKVEHFVVGGGSKRGWTTWTTGAVDKRVTAIVPFVIDMLNMEKSFEHHWQAYGFWAPAVGDYVRMNIMDWVGMPQYKALMKIVEPYSYRDRLTMPKYIVNACGDQFFLPDSWQFYYKDLKGEKYLRYVPNANHGLSGSDAPQSLVAWYDMIVTGTPRPRFAWKAGKSGDMMVKVVDKPKEVRLWQATNPAARDFRLEKIGKAWTSTVLTETKPGLYVGHVDKPAKGWTAFMVELTYATGESNTFKTTTGVKVVPDVLPFPPRKRAKTPPPAPAPL
jgi:PhoPQ-activated pathogenicity-related protein